MKILIATGIFKPELGGPATYAAELAQRLTHAGHVTTVLTYSDYTTHPIDAQYTFPVIRVKRRKNKILNYISYFLKAHKEIKKHDVIYSLDWFSAGVPLMFAAKLLGREYVVRVGGGYIWEKYLSQGKPPMPLKEFYERGLYKQYKVMYWLIKKVLQRAYLVIFNSDEQRELYRTFYKLEYRRIITIYNAVPEHKFGNLLQSYKMRNYDRDKEFVFAGRFIKMKNVESLIRAFAKVQDREFKLLLIGEGPTEPELHSIVKELKLEHRVTFMKPLSQLELYRRIANCYCVIIPSWTDISPHQAYECLALGIPFLLTKENYLSINKKNFVKIDPNSVDDIAEKMNWLLDGEHYMEFTESLEKLRFKRTWADVVSDHMKIFATMI